ncbi:uncharacterized protein LOC108850223 [Raphanus sativus]|uniref:Uncharacterized protein LOC108850223 n=1 Tax=Raphanus sativus TaxID=3726 RepID=A0A9W3DJH0_RAPSA|nr:uncharacterized protein LOC108850223 [Raphanus sativus]
MKSAWKIPGIVSDLNPPTFTSSELPPPLPVPPDPPDPNPSLSPIIFPPLSSASATGSKSSLRNGPQTPPLTFSYVLPVNCTSVDPPASSFPLQTDSIGILSVRSETTVHVTVAETPFSNQHVTLTATHLPLSLPVQPESAHPKSLLATPPEPTPSSSVPDASNRPYQASQPPSLVERIRLSEDITLQRLAPVSLSASGRPRVRISDDIFQIGANLHKDFIVCYYNGKAPPFNQIQSVLTHMWGRGKRLELHNNPLNRSTTVRIPCDFLREKILDKCIWYVGETMFHTAPFSEAHSASTPSLKAIKIWAHLTGEPKETDDFTKNLVSLTLSHVKVEVDLTKLLPSVVEFERDSGEVVEVLVHYPWVPSTCSHYKELGHVVRNCLTYTLPPPLVPPADQTKAQGKKPLNPETNPSSSSHPTRKQTTNKKPNSKMPSQKYVLVLGNKLSTLSTTNPTDSFSTPPTTSAMQVDLPEKNLSTNLRGLNDPVKHRPFSSWLLTYKPLFGALLETHIKELSLAPIMSKICHNWNYVSNHSSDEDGRIVLIWKDPLRLQVVKQSRKSMTCTFTLPNQQPIYFTSVYAANTNEEMIDLWAELIQLHSTLDLQTNQWIIGGDFNHIIYPTEHSYPTIVVPDSLMYQLQDCFTHCGVFDLRYNGPSHTWTNHQPDSPIGKKLDRLLVNHPVISSHPHAFVSFLPPLFSDHSPCLLDLAYSLPTAETKPFKFQNYLTKHPNFLEVISRAWVEAGNICTNLTQLCWKLKNIKSDLKTLNRENYSNIQERVTNAYSLLQSVQVQALYSPTPLLFQQERDLHQRWLFLRLIEESYLRQKSRINWLSEGDFNTTFFHRMCQVWESYNAIRYFLYSSGTLITDPQEMSDLAVAHFRSIVGPLNYLRPGVWSSHSWFSDLIPFRCTLQQSQLMLPVPTADAIRALFFKLNPNKAPGPDGLTSGFFKASWETIGTEVVDSIQNFFITGFLPTSTNATILSMVPKFPRATKISDFRPIACLNTVYKVISRLLVARLKPILEDLILPCQTAFVKGRLLVENTVLAGELVHGYHKNKGPPRITIKVDIAKAFDTLSWEFLFTCLDTLNLPRHFITLLKACVCKTSFMVGYNGMVNGYFKGKRGLRQGDPFSPYLFVIAMNCLSFMLNSAATKEKIKYHANCKKLKMTHLSFADDLLIFIDGSIESLQQVLHVLKEFEQRSRLAISMQKTSFYASRIPAQVIDTIQASTGMLCGELPVRYLGVPLNSRKLTLVTCEPLIHQIKKRLSSWSVKSLSFAGRLLLIKTVIAGITTFWCAAFILPKACVKRINSLCSVFLWRGDIESHNTARVSWETVVLTKKQGVLGVKDLQTWNKACCLKLIWLLFFKSGSVWVAWFKEVILKGSIHNYWTTKPKASFSWLANKLIKLKDEVFPLIKVRLENGLSARFWFDNWSPFERLATYLNFAGSRLGIPLSATVASLHRNGSWHLPPARSEQQTQLQIHLTTVNLSSDSDYFEWEIGGKVSDTYSTGDVYTYLRGVVNEVDWAEVVWNSYGIPRHNFHTWLVLLDRCPTRDRMLQWGLSGDVATHRIDHGITLSHSFGPCRRADLQDHRNSSSSSLGSPRSIDYGMRGMLGFTPTPSVQ